MYFEVWEISRKQWSLSHSNFKKCLLLITAVISDVERGCWIDSLKYVIIFHLFMFYVVLLCIFTFLVPCCDVRYDFCIKTMFGSSLPPVVLHDVSCLIYVICVCLRIVVFVFFCWSSSCVLCDQCCQFLWIVHFGFL
jgi:hypothetical protein